MTLLEANAIIRKADKLFEAAARAWERGNNTDWGRDYLAKCNDRCDKLRNEAETILRPLGIKCDYPGLYPSFTVNGFTHYSAESAVSEALEQSGCTYRRGDRKERAA